MSSVLMFSTTFNTICYNPYAQNMHVLQNFMSFKNGLREQNQYILTHKTVKQN